MPLIDGIKQNIVTPEAGINVRVDAFVLDNNSIFFFRNKHIYSKTVASNESSTKRLTFLLYSMHDVVGETFEY